MKESYGEGLAIHTDPESCVGVREGVGEALTGAHAGWVLSREITHSRRRPCGSMGKATLAGAHWRALGGPREVVDPTHAWKLLARKPGDLSPGRPSEKDGPHREGSKSRSR